LLIARIQLPERSVADLVLALPLGFDLAICFDLVIEWF
jgi:hypothetical protein